MITPYVKFLRQPSAMEVLDPYDPRREQMLPALPLPRYAKPGDAGLDLMAAIDKRIMLAPHKHALVPTGWAIELPEGYEAQVRPRSGLAAKSGITILNAPGTIDQGFRGEICAILINHSNSTFKIQRGDRIAQLVIAPVSQAQVYEADALSESERGADGFGSTGI